MKGYLLDVGSVRISRLEAQSLELLGEIGDGQLFAPGAGPPPLEPVRCQDADVREHRVRINA